jgi:hypothetical protein
MSTNKRKDPSDDDDICDMCEGTGCLDCDPDYEGCDECYTGCADCVTHYAIATHDYGECVNQEACETCHSQGECTTLQGFDNIEERHRFPCVYCTKEQISTQAAKRTKLA